MIKVGYSPSVRLFEAAACGAPIISDRWPGIESFFVPGREILLAKGAEGGAWLSHRVSEQESAKLQVARSNVFFAITLPARRAQELEEIIRQVADSKECGVNSYRLNLMSTIRAAIVGVGNCASSLVQGVEFYRDVDGRRLHPGSDARQPGWLSSAGHRLYSSLRRESAQGRSGSC